MQFFFKSLIVNTGEDKISWTAVFPPQNTHTLRTTALTVLGWISVFPSMPISLPCLQDRSKPSASVMSRWTPSKHLRPYVRAARTHRDRLHKTKQNKEKTAGSSKGTRRRQTVSDPSCSTRQTTSAIVQQTTIPEPRNVHTANDTAATVENKNDTHRRANDAEAIALQDDIAAAIGQTKAIPSPLRTRYHGPRSANVPATTEVHLIFPFERHLPSEGPDLRGSIYTAVVARHYEVTDKLT